MGCGSSTPNAGEEAPEKRQAEVAPTSPAPAPAKEEAAAAGNAASADGGAAAAGGAESGDGAKKPTDSGRFSDSDEEEEACIDKETGKVKRSNSITDMYSGEAYQEMLQKMMGKSGGLGMGGYDLESAEREMRAKEVPNGEPTAMPTAMSATPASKDAATLAADTVSSCLLEAITNATTPPPA